MTGSADASKDRLERLRALLQACARALDNGQADPQEFLRKHPELVEELTAFFSGKPARSSADAPTLAPGSPNANNADFTLAAHGCDPDATMPPDGPAMPQSLDVRRFGDYELLEEISRGGMGVVYRARQISLNRQVALKMILAGQLASDAQVQRFYSEAKAAGTLDHANIVPIYEVNQHQGRVYYTMKLIGGGSLGEIIDNCRKTAADLTAYQADSARLIATVARAIHHAHQRGILHRDLKPANILLQIGGTERTKDETGNSKDDGHVRRATFVDGLARTTTAPGPPPASIIAQRSSFLHASVLKSAIPLVADFGLAKQFDDEEGLTQSGAIVGTPSYMAPEQARAEKGLTTAADVYSLGAILFELLTGRPPFQAATTLQTVLHVLEHEPTPPRSINDHVDADLETICLKCLDKDPRRRYASAEALAQDLERWLAGEPILARTVGGGERLWRWCRRNPVVAALLAAVVLSIVGGIAATTYFAIEAVDQAVIAKEHAANFRTEKERAEQQAELAKDILARSLFEQAQTLRRSNKPGRRDVGLHLLRESEKLSGRAQITRLRPAEGLVDSLKLSAKLPTRLELRNEAVALLLAQDARLQREVRPTFGRACLGPDGLLAVWNWFEADRDGVQVNFLTSNQPPRRWELTSTTVPGSFQGVISPDRKWIASTLHEAGSEWLELRELNNGKIVKKLAWPTDKDSEPTWVAFSTDLAVSADGSHAAGVKVSSKRVEYALWDLKKDSSRVFSHENKYRSHWVAFSAAGKMLMYPAADRTIVCWDLPGNSKLGEIDLPLTITGPAVFNLDGVLAVPCRNREDNKPAVVVWDFAQKAERFRFPLTRPVFGKGLSYRPATSQLAVGDGSQAVLIDAVHGKEIFRFDTGTAISQCVWQPDGEHLVTLGTNETIKIWKLSEKPPLFSLQPAVERAAKVELSGDGRWMALAAADSPRAWLIERKTAKVEREFAPKLDRPGQGGFDSILFRADSKQFAALGWIGQSTAHVWDLAGGETARLSGNDQFYSIAFGPTGHLLVARGSAARLAVWDVNEARELWHTTVSEQTVAYLSPDGRYLVGYPLPLAHASALTVWELATGAKIGPVPIGGVPTQLRFSQDGSLLAISHKSLETLTDKVGSTGLGVWSLLTGKKILDKPGTTGQHLDFSPDNRLLAALSNDGATLLAVADGSEIFTWPVQARDLAFTADGAYLATIPPAVNPQEGGSSVQFLDLANLRRRLTDMKLGW